MEFRGRARVAEREVACGGEKLPTRPCRVQTLTATASPESVIKGHNITRTSHNTTKNYGSSGMQTCPAACGRAREAPYYPTVVAPRVTQRSAEHAARVGRRGHEALLHGLGQVLERARGVVEEDSVGLAVGADCAPRGASTCEAAARACTVAGGGAVCAGEGAPSRIMSKYCVTIMRSMTVLASTPLTSLLKALTLSRSPSMIACRWREMP